MNCELISGVSSFLLTCFGIKPFLLPQSPPLCLLITSRNLGLFAVKILASVDFGPTVTQHKMLCT